MNILYFLKKKQKPQKQQNRLQLVISGGAKSKQIRGESSKEGGAESRRRVKLEGRGVQKAKKKGLRKVEGRCKKKSTRTGALRPSLALGATLRAAAVTRLAPQERA